MNEVERMKHRKLTYFVFLLFLIILLANVSYAEPPPIPAAFGGYIYKTNIGYQTNMLVDASSGDSFQTSSSNDGSYMISIPICGGELTDNCIQLGDVLIFKIENIVVKTITDYEQGANRLDLYLNEDNKLDKISTEKVNIEQTPSQVPNSQPLETENQTEKQSGVVEPVQNQNLVDNEPSKNMKVTVVTPPNDSAENNSMDNEDSGIGNIFILFAVVLVIVIASYFFIIKKRLL